MQNYDLGASEQKMDAQKKKFSPEIEGQITASIINGIFPWKIILNLDLPRKF